MEYLRRVRRVHQVGRLATLAVLALGCSPDPYVELIVADPTLPFLAPGTDFDALDVAARADGCGDVVTRFAAAPLPATLTVVPGDCYAAAFELRATATLADRVVAESAWIAARFAGSGAVVVTATMADVAGRLVRFSTGYEIGEPHADALGGLPVVRRNGVAGVDARVVTTEPLSGVQSARLAGTATVATGFVFARVAATNLVIARGDELVLSIRVAGAARTVGIELELSTGASAAGLRLVDADGNPVHAASSAGRVDGERQQWTVDLSAAAGARLVGILLGFDARSEGSMGAFLATIDDIAIIRP